MVTQLSTTFGADFSSIKNMLASYLAPAPLASATAPFGPITVFSDDDEVLEEEDFDLIDF